MNKYKILPIFNIFIFLFFNFLSVAQPQPKFHNLSIDNGLSQSTVNCVMKDKAGLMWIGTQDGLNKFDGYTFTTYFNNSIDSNSLSDNFIQSLCEDNDGNIWVGSWSGGLNCLNPYTNKITRFLYKQNVKNGISNNSIMCLLKLKSGSIAIGTSAGIIDLYEPNSKTFKHFSISNHKNKQQDLSKIKCFIEISPNILLVGTQNNGLFYVALEKNECNKIFLKENLEITNAKNIQSIIKTKNQHIWVATLGDGIYELSPNLKLINHFYNDASDKFSLIDNKVTSLIENIDGNIWIGTFGGGISYLDISKQIFYSYQHQVSTSGSISNNIVTNLYNDDGGLIWVCTLGGGLNYFDPSKVGFQHLKFIFTEEKVGDINIIMSICQDLDSNLWLGTYGNGLIKYNIKNKSLEIIKNDFNYSNKVKGNIIRSILFENGKDLWIGTNKGLYLYDTKNKKISEINSPKDSDFNYFDFDVWKIFKDNNNQIWVGTWGKGIKRVNKKLLCFEEINLINSLRIFSDYIVTIDGSKDLIYFGNFKNGLIKAKIDSKNEIFENIDKFNNYKIRCLSVDADSILWIGTDGSGLLKYNLIKNTINEFSKSSGLPNNVVYSIVDDRNGNLWISTNKGLSCFKKNSNLFRNYTVADGLQSNEFNQGSSCYLNNNEISFGGVNGLNIFNPRNIKSNKTIPSIVISNVKLFGKDLQTDTSYIYKKNYTFKYWENFISFEFAALNYISPEKNQYACKMLGFDEDWIQLGTRRFVSYTNLDPGFYEFKIKAANNDGVWNETGVSIFITITPPFWRTTWFYILCILIFILSVYLFIYFRTRKLEKDKEHLEQQVVLRTNEVVKQKNEILEINKELLQQKTEISAQRDEIENKNKSITDSIKYAQKIQQAILPPNELIEQIINDYFVIYQPKDIVSGDFYWVEDDNERLYFAAVDCTGHGVPGALMSMIGFISLNQAIKEHKLCNPSEILNFLNDSVYKILRQSNESSSVKDGMDMALITIDKEKNLLKYAGAYNPIYIIRNGELNELKPDKHPVGIHSGTQIESFTTIDWNLQIGDCIYLFSDGYYDQFSESTGKKFLSKNFKQLLISNSHLEMKAQKEMLIQAHLNWKGRILQVDDILVMGIRYQ